MIEKRGNDRRSMLTGSSTHNQRIERLWRDMHSQWSRKMNFIGGAIGAKHWALTSYVHHYVTMLCVICRQVDMGEEISLTQYM